MKQSKLTDREKYIRFLLKMYNARTDTEQVEAIVEYTGKEDYRALDPERLITAKKYNRRNYL